MPPSSRSAANQNSSSSLHLCKHSPSATLDLLILILVLFSGTFLLSSYFSYLIHSLSLLSSHFPSITISLSSLLPPLIIFFSSDHSTEDEDHHHPSGKIPPPASFFFAFAVFFRGFNCVSRPVLWFKIKEMS
jgi:divalent metal cation (Fe/Co/Zn/Cd) transporter